MAKKKDLAGVVGGIIAKPAASNQPASIATPAQEKKPAPRATFVVDPVLTRKMKFIALSKGRLYKDVIAEALTQYIADFENEHGAINMVAE